MESKAYANSLSIHKHYGICSPDGTVMVSFATTKQCTRNYVCAAAATMFGYYTKRGTWRELYRKGWRVLPVSVMNWDSAGWTVWKQKEAA